MHPMSIGVVRVGVAAGFVALGIAAPPASAQLNNQWLTLTKDTTRIVMPDTTVATQITTDTEEKDFAWGDLNKDGWDDLVDVRKTPGGNPGKRVNYLLMNENVGGIRKFVDRTAQYATATDVVGDAGFNTATDDRDVEIGDVDGDTWPDVVTACQDLANENGTAFKNVTHPRVYRNLGGAGAWQGLKFENARIPKLTVTAGGANGTVRFCDITLGDVDNDGDLDIYASDCDATGAGFAEPAGSDLNDRLLLNNGNGFYVDSYGLNIPAATLICSFGSSNTIADCNGDGKRDVVRVSTSTVAPRINVFYNDVVSPTPATTGVFDSFQSLLNETPWTVAAGDLNNDGKVDLVSGDDASDHYVLNTGNAGSGQVNWSAWKNFVYLSGSSDDGFVGAVKIVDLNVDGWQDVFIADVDTDVPGCNRRSKIYHNATTTPGTQSTTLREEKQQGGASGWFGAVGLLASDMTGGFDGAFPDIDRDGDPDFVFGECNGTTVWINQTNPQVCAQNLGFQGPGNLSLAVCGQPLYAGNTATLTLSNGTVGGTAYFFASVSALSTPVGLLGGTLAAFPIALSFSLPIGAGGTLAFPVAGGLGEITIDLQVLGTDPSQPHGLEFSNAVRIAMHGG